MKKIISIILIIAIVIMTAAMADAMPIKQILEEAEARMMELEDEIANVIDHYNEIANADMLLKYLNDAIDQLIEFIANVTKYM